jgi:hypothetical protein
VVVVVVAVDSNRNLLLRLLMLLRHRQAEVDPNATVPIHPTASNTPSAYPSVVNSLVSV